MNFDFFLNIFYINVKLTLDNFNQMNFNGFNGKNYVQVNKRVINNFENFDNDGFDDFDKFTKDFMKDNNNNRFVTKHVEIHRNSNQDEPKYIKRVIQNDDDFGEEVYTIKQEPKNTKFGFEDMKKMLYNNANKPNGNTVEEPEVENEYENNDFYGYSNSNDNFDLELFRKESLEEHNIKRNKHHVEDLVTCPELEKIAQKYAEYLAKSNMFQHSNGKFKGDYMGENLYMQGGRKMTGKLAVQSWYDEIKSYNFANPNKSNGTVGHFTQLIWKDSKKLGVGCAKSRDGSYFVVANYYPAGNFIGEEKRNVFPTN